VKEASGPSGLIVYRGYLVAQWGDPSSVEMTFSATKSFLSAIAGLAFDRGLIPNIHAPVSDSVALEAFSSDRHRRITWHHLLTQTSEWDGTLWGKPYWADTQGHQLPDQTLGEPGTVWSYNDVRINLLALALAHLWRQPLSKVLKDEVMDPIGASSSWQWPGYENCYVEVEGFRFPTAGGGAHWGDGLWASSSDLARFGLLMLAKGQWGTTRILSERWIEMATTPSQTNPAYGYLWWVNARRRVFPSAPSSGYCARGNGGRHLIWIDPKRDLVIVSRWGESVERLLALVSRAVPNVGELR
jgi:CubicO group peptidase (beta-lactamase class C family)